MGLLEEAFFIEKRVESFRGAPRPWNKSRVREVPQKVKQ
jgi:hypothetical protein